MIKYNEKAILQCDLSVGNTCRKEYVDSVNNFIDKKYKESFVKRNDFSQNIVESQEDFRKQYLEMIGQPVYPYPQNIPGAKTELAGKDDFCDVYRLQIEVTPEFWFYGIFMVPHGVKNAPLVIAQHGGGGTPELCSDFVGQNNYSYFTKRALERGMAVFAPQLLLWKFNIDTGDPKPTIDLPYDRGEIDRKLKRLGMSITGLDVFCIRRSIDYLSSLDFIDEKRIAMMGLSYGGYFSMYTAAADKRIKSIYAAGFFNDRSKICFMDWEYKDMLNTFCDAEVAALCAPRRLQIDVGKTDPVFDYTYSVNEGERAEKYYSQFGASDNFRFNLWEGGHKFDESEKGFSFFFEGI